jgi:SNF2 family DNA or RNA helicase
MGLGKTLQGLAVAAAYVDEWPLLVVVPASVRWSWVDEMERWLPSLLRPANINVVENGNNSEILNPQKLVTVVTFPLMTSPAIAAQVQQRGFKVVIVDESHYLQSGKTKRSQAVVPIVKAATRAVLLSGTPALSRPCDLHCQLDALRPGYFGSFHQYSLKFCGATRRFMGRRSHWDVSGHSNLPELHSLLKTHFMIRRLKADVLQQLPPKRRQVIKTELASASHRAQMEECAGNLKAAISGQSGGGGFAGMSELQVIHIRSLIYSVITTLRGLLWVP